jgi:ferredoxin-NADP reductase
MMRVILEKKEKINHNVTTFWFKPPRKFNYIAGQFIEMTLPVYDPDERGSKHWFTLSSSPTEELISITTKWFGDKASTFKKTLFGLKPGAEVNISDPMGDFVLPKDKSIPLVFVAGGIGITPYRSIIKWLIDTGEKRQIQAILAAHSDEDLLFAGMFRDYGVEPVLAVDARGQRLSAKFILESVSPINNKLIYISGPEQMVEALDKDLENSGVPKHQLVGDYFPGYSVI